MLGACSHLLLNFRPTIIVNQECSEALRSADLAEMDRFLFLCNFNTSQLAQLAHSKNRKVGLLPLRKTNQLLNI
jgi:hypothetical protein